jgi:transcription elongation factor Elf1
VEFIVLCKKCGRVLLEADADSVLKKSDWHSDLLRQFNGKCPGCGHELSSQSKMGAKVFPLRKKKG